MADGSYPMTDHTIPDSESVSPEARRVLGEIDEECVVEYCIRNVDPQNRGRLDVLASEVHEHFCLQRCGDCEAEPFLIVNGEYVPGPHGSLVAALRAREDRS